ncbi:hypothetical protein VOLCADRAFT_86751 [Volvox carteri f. nagariensis]|uniref:Sulfatase N-terminal domain-containing protein n=1 Tax=Volvox carteri f. nagariensis TaxID=3068 RepID=D8TJI2_VOLCA|nr:uncharacterized protein VOLCADRAFT_86751 [Volvox carteri f. nagariensis]EFJ52546.1 hypothetical protein VOLCADRAFT_86751 [Volvox carteri f. nagariensis]|eukprot:XP_002946619.1 hypothetical protein VOLCADRAFT_86751 [Volvox carteri f. nagariensis]
MTTGCCCYRAGCGSGGGVHCSRGTWGHLRPETGRSVGRPVVVMTLLLLLQHLLAPGAEAAPTRAKAPPPPPLPPPPAPRPPRAPAGSRPNFVVIVTDDQDEVLNSTHPAYMPALSSLLGSEGTRFANTLVSTSVCCPARVSLLTGRLAHCTNVTSNWAPMGAWNKFIRQGLDSDWLPGWLRDAGYRTALVGKLLNGFSIPLNQLERCPLGIDHLDALTDGTYNLYNSSFSLNCGPSQAMMGQYQTDVIRDKALAYIEGAVAAGSPFYLQLDPAAPHVDNGGGEGWRPPPPAQRHADLYPGLELPDNPTFLKVNPLNPFRTRDMNNPENVKDATDLYVGRIRSLRAVDEMVGAIVAKLSDLGILDNTYVIYMSDNGLHMGQHSLDDGKATPIEEDSRVPLYLRGPGVPAGVVSAYQANLVDFAPTVRALAGLPPRPDLDGVPLPIEGLTTDAYDAVMRLAVAAAAQRAGLLPPLPPGPPGAPPSPLPPPSLPRPSPLASPPPKRPRAKLAPSMPVDAGVARVLGWPAPLVFETPSPQPQPLAVPEALPVPVQLPPSTQSQPLAPEPPPPSPHPSPPSPHPSPPSPHPSPPSPHPSPPSPHPSPPSPHPSPPSPQPSPPSPHPSPPSPHPSPPSPHPSLPAPQPSPPSPHPSPPSPHPSPPSPHPSPPSPQPSLPAPHPSPPSPHPSLPAPHPSPPSPHPSPPSPQPPTSAPAWLREAVLLEAWDSDAKSGFFPGITFKALRLCSAYQANLKAPPSPPSSQRRPPPPMQQSPKRWVQPPPSPSPPRQRPPLPFPPSPSPQQPSPPYPPPSPLRQQPAASRPPALMVPQPPHGPTVYCLKYIVWCKDNGRELYDLSHDPYEADNVLGQAAPALLSRLDAVLSVLVHCRGGDCVHPYGVLHPAGDVLTFAEAMHPSHDKLYASLPPFAFATCYPGYVPPNERTFTLGMRGFPANVTWESTGITWPLPPGVRGIKWTAGES